MQRVDRPTDWSRIPDMRRLRIEVDRASCASNGLCIRLAAGTFAEDSQGLPIVIEPPRDSEETILEAALNCPTASITVVDAASGEDLLDG